MGVSGMVGRRFWRFSKKSSKYLWHLGDLWYNSAPQKNYPNQHRLHWTCMRFHLTGGTKILIPSITLISHYPASNFEITCNQRLGKGLRVLENRGGKTRHSSIYLGVQYAGGKRLPNTDFDFLTLLQEQVLFRKNSSDMVDFFPKVNIFWKLFVLCFLNTLKEKFWSISLVTLISHVNKICFLNTRKHFFLIADFLLPSYQN